MPVGSTYYNVTRNRHVLVHSPRARWYPADVELFSIRMRILLPAQVFTPRSELNLVKTLRRYPATRGTTNKSYVFNSCPFRGERFTVSPFHREVILFNDPSLRVPPRTSFRPYFLPWWTKLNVPLGKPRKTNYSRGMKISKIIDRSRGRFERDAGRELRILYTRKRDKSIWPGAGSMECHYRMKLRKLLALVAQESTLKSTFRRRGVWRDEQTKETAGASFRDRLFHCAWTAVLVDDVTLDRCLRNFSAKSVGRASYADGTRIRATTDNPE